MSDKHNDLNKGTHICIKEEPQLVDFCYDEIPIKSYSESHEDIDCDEKFVSQAAEYISSCLNLDRIKCENLEESSSFSSYVDQDFKPNMNNESFCIKPHKDSEVCFTKECKHEDTHWDVKKEDSSVFQQDNLVIGCGSQEGKLESHESLKNVETKFVKPPTCDCFHKDSDASFDLKPAIDILVKSEVDDNAHSNKGGQHLMGNTHFMTETYLEKQNCLCKEKRSHIKEETISIVSQSSHLVKDTDIDNKSNTTDDFQSLQSDLNTGTEIGESNCDWHALLIQGNLSNILKKNKDNLNNNKQDISLISNSHMFGEHQDLLLESSSSVHRLHAQSYTEDPFMKNCQSPGATSLRPFKCSECSKCFIRKSHLTRHVKEHKGLKTFQCSECSKCFTRKTTLTLHENIHKGLRPFKCSECSKCFSVKCNLIQHEKLHKGLKTFQCSECSKCFAQKIQLTLHENIHKGLRPFKCSECFKCFTQQSTLKRHEQIHTDLKPFQCLECFKCFNDPSGLRQHEKIHKGLKDFQCLECSKHFNKIISLRNHERTHKVLNPFKCFKCSKCFTDKSTLTQHEKTHKVLKTFQCLECYKYFTRKSDLKKHTLRKHNG